MWSAGELSAKFAHSALWFVWYRSRFPPEPFCRHAVQPGLIVAPLLAQRLRKRQREGVCCWLAEMGFVSGSFILRQERQLHQYMGMWAKQTTESESQR